MIWSGTSPITRARPPRQGTARSAAAIAPMCTVRLTQSGTAIAADLAHRPAALEHELGHEGLEVGEHEDVGPPARRDRAEVRSARGRRPG